MKEKGFALVEAVIVVAILVVLSATVVPLVFVAMRRSQLNACAQQLAAHFRYARSLAIARNLNGTNVLEQVIFTPPDGSSTEQSYQVCRDTAACASASREKDPLDPTKELYIIMRDSTGKTGRSEWDGITISTVQFPIGNSQRAVYFDRNGGAVSVFGTPLQDGVGVHTSGIVTLKNKSNQTISVYVAPDTGEIYVEEP